MDLPNIFKGNYKLLLIPPVLLLVLSVIFMPQLQLGVDFRGGTLVSLTLEQGIDAEQLRADLADEGLEADVRVFETAVGFKAEVEVPQGEDLLMAEELKDRFETLLFEATNLELQAGADPSKTGEYNQKMDALWGTASEMFSIAGVNYKKSDITGVNDVDKLFRDAYKKVYADYEESITDPISRHVDYDSISVQTVSPMLSIHFMDTAIKVALFAALLSAVFVFAFFRVVVPSIAVIVGATCDIIIALGAMGLFGIPLTLPSFAALLMLVGYSLDTDILLTMRMLKRKGDPRHKAHDAMKTGLTMSLTAIISFGTLFVLAYLTHIRTYFEISAVALAGLVGDIIATWGINAVMLLWYAEKKED